MRQKTFPSLRGSILTYLFVSSASPFYGRMMRWMCVLDAELPLTIVNSISQGTSGKIRTLWEKFRLASLSTTEKDIIFQPGRGSLRTCWSYRKGSAWISSIFHPLHLECRHHHLHLFPEHLLWFEFLCREAFCLRFQKHDIFPFPSIISYKKLQRVN